MVAAALWDADSDTAAMSALNAIAMREGVFEELAAAPDLIGSETEELANVGGTTGGVGEPKTSGKRHRRRSVPPVRTPDEIAALRSARAAKRAVMGAPPHRDGRAP